jgi:thioredoxin-like negative regulator of GroEL
MITSLTAATFADFIAEAEVAVVHFDARWNTIREKARLQMQIAAERLGGRARFAEIDIDDCPELARAAEVGNVPAISYYRQGQRIATLVGTQDVLARTNRVLVHLPIGPNDDTTPATARQSWLRWWWWW